MIQYSPTVLTIRELTAYWMLAGACHRAAIRPTRWRVLRRGLNCRYAEAGCFTFASIWPIASTTASKVSMVEAWRAL
jgi:hypothetical protein